MARLLVVSRSMALAMRLADVHDVIEHSVEAIADLMPGPGIDVVVLDVGEPTVAMQALDQVRSAERLVPVLVVSGYQPTWTNLATVDLPEVIVVPLPITRAALLDGVDNLLCARQPPDVGDAVRHQGAQGPLSWSDPVQDEVAWGDPGWKGAPDHEPADHEPGRRDLGDLGEPDATPPLMASPFFAPRQRSSEIHDSGASFGTASFGTTTWPGQAPDGETVPDWDELIAPTAAPAAAGDRQGGETPIARHSRENADPRSMDPARYQHGEPSDDGWSPAWAWQDDVNGSAQRAQVASPATEGHENDHWSLEPPPDEPSVTPPDPESLDDDPAGGSGETPPDDRTADEHFPPVEVATPPPLPSGPPAPAHTSGPAVPPPLPSSATPPVAPPSTPQPVTPVLAQPPPLPAAATRSAPLIEREPPAADGEQDTPMDAEPDVLADDEPDAVPDARPTPPRLVPPPLPPVDRRPAPHEPSEPQEPEVVDDDGGARAEDVPAADEPGLASTDTRSLILPFPTTGTRLGEPTGWADQGFDWWSQTDAPTQDEQPDQQPDQQPDEPPDDTDLDEQPDEPPDEPDPVDTDPVDTDPVDTDPVDTDPVDTDPVDTDPVDTDPVEQPLDEPRVEAEPEAVPEVEALEPDVTDPGVEAEAAQALARRREVLGRTDPPQHPTELDRRLTGIPFRTGLGPAGTSAELIALAGSARDGQVPPRDLPPSGPALLAAGPHTEPQPLPTAALIETVSARIGELYGVCDAAQMLADEIVEIADADAAAVLVPDGGLWAVSGGVGLRPAERQLVLDAGHWLVAEIAVGGRALLVEDTDVVRPKLAGAPLAAWRHLLAVPIPEVRSAVVLARGQESGPFGEQDLAALVDPVRRSVSMMHTALATRHLARQLAPLRELDMLQ